MELKYKLLNWINKDYLHKFNLSSNPNAIHFLEEYPKYIEGLNLSSNIQLEEHGASKEYICFTLLLAPGLHAIIDALCIIR
jgi:hypothetical protein